MMRAMFKRLNQIWRQIPVGALLGSLLLTSCAAWQPVRKIPAPTAPGSGAEAAQTRTELLAQAKSQLALGETSKSIKSLEEIIAGPPEPGITDEALLQLALLNLRPNVRDGANRSHQLLQILVRDHPRSSWTQMGQPVLELLDTIAEQKRQAASLRGHNQALSKEIKELHQTIERLKSLDLELEKKIRR